MKDYQNGMSWQWLGCMNVVSKQKAGLKKEANDLLCKISEIIVKYDGAYEVYENTGKPVKRKFYKSEQPFAWSSGLFIYAHEQLNSK